MDFLVKTNSKSLLCLQFVAQAFGVKGVEMCPHSSLTALEPAPMSSLMVLSAPAEAAEAAACDPVQIIKAEMSPLFQHQPENRLMGKRFAGKNFALLTRLWW